MSRESDLETMSEHASAAYARGEVFFVAKLKIGAWSPPGHGELAQWSDNLEVIEAAGWVLDRWAVAADAGGGMAAYPVFRRGDGVRTALRDRSVTGS